MKYFVAVLCLAQIVLSAPNEPSLVEEVQNRVAAVQQQAQAAVKDLNEKVLQASGAQSNVQLLETIQTQAQSYATQVKGLTDQISKQAADNKATIDTNVNAILKQLSDSAATLLGQKDPAKVEQLQGTFTSVLTQAGALQNQLQQQGATVQDVLTDALGKLYQNTLDTAKNVATQLDAGRTQ